MRRALPITRGDASVFIREPISAGLLAVAAISLIFVLIPSVRKTRAIAQLDDE